MKTVNSSRGKIKFWLFTIITLIVSIADLTLTYIGTPDLSMESNPLVYTAGLGWGTLIITNIIIFVSYVILYYYTFLRFKPSIIHCDGFKQFLSMLFFNRPDKFIWVLYKFPKSKIAWSYIGACVGHICVIISIARLRTVFEWIGIISKSEWIYSYFDAIKNIGFVTPLGRFDMFLWVLLLAILVLCYWFYKEYKINKKALECESTKLAA